MWEEIERKLHSKQEAGLTIPNILTIENDTQVLESRLSIFMLDFLGTVMQVCEKYHNSNCFKCHMLSWACLEVRERKVVRLSVLWRCVHNIKYQSDRARRLFLQAPLDFFTVGKPDISDCYVVEKSGKELYAALMMARKGGTTNSFELDDHRQLIKDISSIAENEAQRDLIKYTAAAVANASFWVAQKKLGISMGRGGSRNVCVATAVKEMKMQRGVNRELTLIEIEGEVSDIPEYLKDSRMTDSDSDSESASESECAAENEDEGKVQSEHGKEGECVSDEVATQHNITDEELVKAWKEGTMWDILLVQEGDEVTMTDESEDDEDAADNQDVIVRRIVSKYPRSCKVMLAKARLLRRKTSKQEKH